MDIFLIDSWDQNNKDKQIKFLRQAVSVSGEVVPFSKLFVRHAVVLSRDLVPLE